MASHIQSGSFPTKQVLVGPGDNVAIDIGGQHYPVIFINNGGPLKGQFQGPTLVLENFDNALGTAIQFQVPINGVQKKLNIVVHTHGQAPTAYRQITWSLY